VSVKVVNDSASSARHCERFTNAARSPRAMSSQSSIFRSFTCPTRRARRAAARPHLDRLNQVDVRLGKRFTVGRTHLRLQVDLYSVMNNNVVLLYETTTERSEPRGWCPNDPFGRLLKFGGQLSF
jgi:hypothetical protein